MLEKLKVYFLRPRFTLSRLQFNLIAVIFISFGLTIGVYLTLSNFIPRIFASASPWTQTDWSGGTSSGTVNSTVTTSSEVSNTDPTTSVGDITLATNTGWYNSSWKYRRKLTLDNTTSNLGVTSEALTDFPVLVVLTSSNIDYSNTQNSGQDLRFTDSNGTTLLSYEIEKWDESGTSYVWVKVPQIDINSSTDYIYMYYGNSGASDAQSATNVWDSSYKMVQHFAETSGTTTSDSTSNDNDGAKVSSTQPASTTSGRIGNAQSFSNNQTDFITCGTNNVPTTSPVTLEAWAYYAADQPGGYYSYVMQLGNYNNDIFAMAREAGTNLLYYPQAGQIRTGPVLATGQWLHQVIVFNSSPPYVAFYINGVSQSVTQPSAPVAPGSAVCNIGRYNGPNWYIYGLIDEVRISSSVRSAAYVAASYHSETNDFVSFESQVGTYASSGTLTSNILDSEQLSAWGTLTYSGSGSTIGVKVRSSNSSTMSGADDWSSCSSVSSGTDLSSTDCATDGERYIQYQVILSTADQTTTPTFQDISIAFSSYDTTSPTTNASSISMATASSGGRSISSNGWNNASGPYFSWTAGADNVGGSGLKGYCLYLGTDSAGNPATAKGVLGTSPVSTTGSTCQFIASSTNIDLNTSGYLGSALTDGSTYYLNIKAIDNGSNVFSGSSAQFQFRQDATAPTNVSYISAASGSFGNVADMNFNWPVSGGSAASDSNAGVLGYQYQLNSSSGTWKGTNTSSTCSLDYIPAATANYTFTADDEDDVQTGTNVIYFRTVDSSCSTSSSSTYRTASISYGGAAPTFAVSCDSTSGVAVAPSSATSNSFELVWDDATPSSGRTVSKYYYMINTSPPSTLSTIISNTSTYISNNTNTSVGVGALTGSVRGSNTVYVVAVDDADNYSGSNCVKGTYTLNSTNPDPPLNLAATDASVKASSLWRVSLGWTVPAYKGTGSLTYKIQRSIDNSIWTDVTITTGTSYIDTVSESRLYYWRVGAYDTSSDSQSNPSYATAVSLTPKGTYTDASSLSSGPTVSSITTKKAKITWSTGRSSDSKIQYGTKSGDYFTEEPSNSVQTTDHTINLTNLSPGTTYYYKAKWTDEDGNTGISSEKTFTTEPKPLVTEPNPKSLSLTTATIEYTVKGASKVKFYYGKTTGFGTTKDVSTSITETTYTTTLEDLEDGVKYFYRINTFDTDGTEYEGDVQSFTTLPRPRISEVRIQQVAKTAQPTALITWNTNTEVSSIITYFPQGQSDEARDEVNIALKIGEHQMIIRGLLPQTKYSLIVKGRDKAGNEAESDLHTFTTATDTRPPQVTDLKVEGTSTSKTAGSGGQNQKSQLVISWNTDEAATSQIEYGEGTGTSYAQKTQEDSKLTFNHVVVISGLTPSKVYHLRVIGKDKAGNIGNSIDTVTITPKSSDNALDLVITNLQQIFGFIGR